ncbi:UNVERIFIED_CONTAM: hypothetical protein Sindi_1837900 [Sesamum indicum]
MTSNSSSNSGSSYGSRSTATPSGSAHGSFSTSPKRNKKFKTSQNPSDKQAGPSTLEKFQDRLARNPWEGVVSSVRTPIEKIRAKYFIPPQYEIIIPRAFDRMHRPPFGFCAFSIKHFDYRLRFSLAPPLARILNKLELCPMQLSPNSISHITFNTEWSKYKPIPKTSGGGLEGDQINSLTAFKYDPKRLLTEKVLRLSGLSPAPLHIDESLGSLIMSSRNALRIKAAQNKLRKGKPVAPPADPSPIAPASTPSLAPKAASPADDHPIQVDSEETPPLPLHGYNSSDLDLNLDDLSEGQGEETAERPDRDNGQKSKKRKRSSRKEGDEEKGKGPVGPSVSSKSSPSNVPAG